VKLLRTAKDRFVFQLGAEEKHVLVHVLKLYPRLPPAHHRLSKTGRLPDAEAGQRLLDEALAEQRAENQKKLLALIADPLRLKENAHGWQLSLSTTEVEWLLQVLNDVRVGSWVLLGSPEKQLKAFDAQTAPHFWAMEMAGAFQMELLHLLEGRRGRET
jgi:hypothetical protein